MTDSNRLEYRLTTQWDGRPIDHRPVVITLTGCVEGVKLVIDAPFFNDPGNPGGPPGQPFLKLWEYEVVEAFFLNDNNQYLELEFCPHGQHFHLILDDYMVFRGDHLHTDFTATISGDTWRGEAVIPKDYFPAKVTKFNAFAMHGTIGKNRVWESLYPVPQGKYDQVDFHRLAYFQPISFKSLLPSNWTDPPSALWTEPSTDVWVNKLREELQEEKK